MSTPAHRIDIVLPARPESVAPARHAVGLLPALTTHPDGADLLGDLRLLISEAAANAVSHGRGDRLRVVLVADPSTGRVTGAVRDGSARLADGTRTTACQTEHESGRGLGIIAALSQSWGFATDGFGKWLWFCLAAHPAPAPPALPARAAA
ncbi:ATP-binding protein (plasmid) [Streptomyces sp. BI20]|uniref:ATP-binding protein n=1 Tax=Streptomyces sp. BI20 TaxID=3403460 RepID=UPI003C73ED7C